MTRRLPITPTWITWFLIFALGFSVAACSSPEERAQAHYQSGQELLKAGEFAKAGLEFRNALKYNEKLSGAWFGLATVEEKNQNWPAVNESLQHVIELDPKNFEALLKLAKLEFAALQLDQALKNINAANEFKKDDPDVYALRAGILLRLNDREGARADAERALAINHDSPDALAVLAADQMVDKNFKAALMFVDRGLLKDQKNLGLLMFKVVILDQSKDDVELEAVLRQILATHPEMKGARQALLAFLSSRKRTAEVEAEMRAWIAIDPTDKAMSLDLVRFVNSTKGAEEARQELEKLIAAQPEVVDYKLALAQFNFTEKKSDKAVADLQAIIIKGEPKDDVLRAQLLLANFSLQLGQNDKAKAIVGDVLKGDAKNADALAIRANLSLNAGELDNAVADLREALNQQPNSTSLLMLLGRAHERQGSVDLANSRYAEAVKASNYATQVTLEYVAFLQRRSKADEAENLLDRAIANNPNDTGLLQALAQLRLSKQDWVGAQAVSEALKKTGDSSSATQQIAGAVLLGQKKYDESIETLKNAYTSAPQTAQLMNALFVAYVQAGKTSEAEAFLNSILAANANNADALVLMGTLKAVQNQPKDAEASFKQAIDRQSSNPVGYVALAKFYLSQNQVSQAEAVLRSGREKVPSDFNTNYLLAGLLESKNDTDGAIAIYEDQLKLTPDALIIVNNLASLLADYRTDPASLDSAKQLAQRLVAIDLPQFKDTIGWVAYRSGDYRNALLNLEQAAEKLPTIALIKFHLGLTYVALKRNADAKDQFAKADVLLKDKDPLKEKIREAVAAIAAGN
jgi:cellulose synthase operon protein C